jgi:hypothetical protein
MRAIFSMTLVALFSTALAGCWFYSRPDSASPDCQKTTYGLALATTTTQDCPPADAGTQPPSNAPPPLPPPSTP